MRAPEERLSEDLIPGYGYMKANWLGEPGRPTGYELAVTRGRTGSRIAVVLDVVVGAEMAPGFQLRSVEGTADPELIARMVDGGVNRIAMDETSEALALRARIGMDLARLGWILNVVRGRMPEDGDDRLVRHVKALDDRIRRLETLRTSVDGWFEAKDGRTFDEAWKDGGGRQTDVINLGTVGIPEFIASAQRASLARLFTDPDAPVNEIRAMAVGPDNEIADIAVAAARAHGIERVHYVSEDYTFLRPDTRAPFVGRLAGVPPVPTPVLADMVWEGRIASDDFVVVDCPEPREFHLDRVVTIMEELGLDVPVLAFNRSFAVMGRTKTLRRYVEDRMDEAGFTPDDPEEAAGIAP